MSAGGLVGAAEAELLARISELSRELESEREARRASERALFEVVDSEQLRLVRLLHETCSQSLNAARVYGRLTRDTIKRSCPEAAAAYSTLEKVIQDAATELQDLMRWLGPVPDGDFDLAAALAELSQLASRTVPCEFQCETTASDAGPESKRQLLRVAQPALHALVQRCPAGMHLAVQLDADDSELVVDLRTTIVRSLSSELETRLDARARVMGGSVTVQHVAEHGSIVTCRMPKQCGADSGSP